MLRPEDELAECVGFANEEVELAMTFRLLEVAAEEVSVGVVAGFALNADAVEEVVVKGLVVGSVWDVEVVCAAGPNAPPTCTAPNAPPTCADVVVPATTYKFWTLASAVNIFPMVPQP